MVGESRWYHGVVDMRGSPLLIWHCRWFPHVHSCNDLLLISYLSLQFEDFIELLVFKLHWFHHQQFMCLPCLCQRKVIQLHCYYIIVLFVAMVSSVYYSDLSPLLDLGSLLVIILCVAYLLIWLKFYDDMALKRQYMVLC